MKAAIYTRVSTDGQAEVEFNSCEAQEIKIRSFISSQNDLEVYKVYSDQGYSGANIDRPAIQQMMADIQKGNINTVISYKIDRLTRSPKDFYQLIEVFEQYGVSFVSVTERFDTSTPSGRLLRNIMLTFAQFERELIGERIRDKMAERAKKGMWNNGRPPFGYKMENKKLAIEPQHAETIKKMYEEYIKSGSVAAVYNKLKSNGLFHRNGLPFLKTVLCDMLRNIVYTGRLNYKGTIYKGIHEPIISIEMFEEAQRLHKERIKSRVVNYALFPGLVHCQACGSTMCAVFTNKMGHDKKRVRYFYYRCCSIEKRDRSFCDVRQVSVDRLDKLIIDYLGKLAKNQQYLDSLIFTLNHQLSDMASGSEISPVSPPISVQRVREILERIIEASKMKDKTEKRVIMKRHIGKVIYSKETIEVKILYSESVDAAYGPLCEPPADNNNSQSIDKDQAAFRHCAPSSRLTSSIVRTKSKMDPSSKLQTLSIIIPNKVHGCKKLDIGRL